jgi:hypothetical protein
MDALVFHQLTGLGKHSVAAVDIALVWLLAAVRVLMGFQATRLGKRRVASVDVAQKRLLACVGSLVNFQMCRSTNNDFAADITRRIRHPRSGTAPGGGLRVAHPSLTLHHPIHAYRSLHLCVSAGSVLTVVQPSSVPGQISSKCRFLRSRSSIRAPSSPPTRSAERPSGPWNATTKQTVRAIHPNSLCCSFHSHSH